MKRFLSLFIVMVTLFSLSACSIQITDDDPIEDDVVYNDDGVDFRLGKVRLINNGNLADAYTLEFYLYAERNDLDLKEPDNDNSLYTADLPESLQPHIMTVEKDGPMCDRALFPHRCEATLSEEDLKNDSLEYEIYTEFEDGYAAKNKVVVPLPELMEEPEVAFPINVPAQGSALSMKFKDVGADRYNVEVSLCHEYQNDGINPCLDQVQYSLIREGDNIVDEFDDDFYMPTIVLKNGIVELSSDMEMNFSDSVMYFVVAGKSGQFDDGLDYYTESVSLKTLLVKSEPK